MNTLAMIKSHRAKAESADSGSDRNVHLAEIHGAIADALEAGERERRAIFMLNGKNR